MESLKIKVNNEAESKEAQELFFELGYKHNDDSKEYYIFHGSYPKFLSADSKAIYSSKNGIIGYKEITLPELRAMVNQDQDEPFLTPECTLNDQYAEIEQVRQAIKVESGSDSDHTLDAMSFGIMGMGADTSSVRQHRHYFKDVSSLDEIDVYMVLKLFNVTDPCLQHIAKKALCAGQRGHKDFERDLQDILDTAKRAIEINKNC